MSIVFSNVVPQYCIANRCGANVNSVLLIRPFDYSKEVDLDELEALQRRDWEEPSELRERDLVECKAHFDECSGFPPCCNTLQCYWEKGYSVTTVRRRHRLKIF